MKSAIDIYYFQLADNGLSQRAADEAVQFLDRREQARMGLFKTPAARKRFLIARFICKTEVARRQTCMPGDINFRYSPNGKPSLENMRCWFSLSHCASAVVCAIANSDLGVDVESTSRCEKLLAKADRFFSATTAEQIKRGQPLPPVTAFTAFWTCLEAQVKLKDSSIFSERRIFELVPGINGRYRNNRNINLLSLETQAGDIISVASHSDFEVCVWQPSGEIEAERKNKKAFQITWQPCAENSVKLLFDAISG